MHVMNFLYVMHYFIAVFFAVKFLVIRMFVDFFFKYNDC